MLERGDTRLLQYLELLARWNRRINLTALPVDPPSDSALDRLILEPIALASLVPDAPIEWFDLGSGGGSPAIPLKIVRPQARLTMVESKTRKAAFLREAIRELELPATRVVEGRFEEAVADPNLRGTAQLVTVRAVRIDEDLFASAAALLAPGGRLLAIGTAPDQVPPDPRFIPEPVEGGLPTVAVLRRTA
jgi:16S rRNA (guanine527-N7)-methyltransferase